MKTKLQMSLALAMAAGVALWMQRSERVEAAATIMAPRFEVDPLWPKPLPNHWVTGSTIGVSVDAQDRVWTIHRPNTVEDNFKAADLKLGECCKAAPPAKKILRLKRKSASPFSLTKAVVLPISKRT